MVKIYLEDEGKTKEIGYKLGKLLNKKSVVCLIGDLGAGKTTLTQSIARGLEIDESCEINTFKSIVLSYTNYKEETWINPQFEKFCSLYEGKQLN